MESRKLEVGDVVQINPSDPRFGGCFSQFRTTTGT